MTSLALSSMAQLPKAGAAFVGAMTLLTFAGGLSASLLKALVLVPGNTVLGAFHPWHVLTFAFIDPNPLKFLLTAFIIIRVGWTAEQPAADVGHRAARRILITVCLSVVTAGLIVSASGLAAYMGSGNEGYLYRPLYGAGPVAAAISVCAHQVAGENGAAISTALPRLPVSLVPISIIIVEALSQYILRISRSFAASCISLFSAWLYLRFFHVYAPGSIGDGRPAFELLSFLPEPFQVPLRPFVNLLSPMLLSLPIFSATTGDGMTSLPGLHTAGGAASPAVGSSVEQRAAGATDAVLERRREIALAQLDRRLAELRSGRGVGARTPLAASSAAAVVAGGAAVTPVATTLSMAAAQQPQQPPVPAPASAPASASVAAAPSKVETEPAARPLQLPAPEVSASESAASSSSESSEAPKSEE